MLVHLEAGTEETGGQVGSRQHPLVRWRCYDGRWNCAV